MQFNADKEDSCIRHAEELSCLEGGQIAYVGSEIAMSLQGIRGMNGCVAPAVVWAE